MVRDDTPQNGLLNVDFYSVDGYIPVGDHSLQLLELILDPPDKNTAGEEFEKLTKEMLGKGEKGPITYQEYTLYRELLSGMYDDRMRVAQLKIAKDAANLAIDNASIDLRSVPTIQVPALTGGGVVNEFAFIAVGWLKTEVALNQLLKDLGHADFRVRTAAATKIEKLFNSAVDAADLTRAILITDKLVNESNTNPDAEVKRSVDLLVKNFTGKAFVQRYEKARREAAMRLIQQ